MRMQIAVAVAWTMLGCGKGASHDAPAAGSSAAKAGSGVAKAAGSGAANAGSGSAAGSGSTAADAEPVAALPDTEAVGHGWKVKAGFGDTQSIFDPTPASLEGFGLEVVNDHGASVFRKTGFAAIAGSAPPPTECEELRVIASLESWGERAGVRVSLICVNGEDDKTAHETAILLEVHGDRPEARVLWAGDADDDHNEMDTCMTSHSVKFTIKGTTLHEAVTDSVKRSRGAPRDCKTKRKRSTATVELHGL